jgi:hypothetical protein
VPSEQQGGKITKRGWVVARASKVRRKKEAKKKGKKSLPECREMFKKKKK